ncbi:MAG TPA: hypothetical protein PKA20_27310 [Burkholderiaceae bacterium]|nr:hypothetical protein [Burkholderiaceae bacterium]
MKDGGSRSMGTSFAGMDRPMPARMGLPLLASVLACVIVAAALSGCNRGDTPAGSGEAARTPGPGAPADQPPAIRGTGPAEGGTSIGGMTNGQGGSGGGQEGVGGSAGSRSTTGGDGSTEDQKPANQKPVTPGGDGSTAAGGSAPTGGNDAAANRQSR